MPKENPKKYPYIKFAMMKRVTLQTEDERDKDTEPAFCFIDVDGCHGTATSIQNFIDRGLVPVGHANFEKLEKKDPEKFVRLTNLVNSYTGKGMDPKLKAFIDPAQSKLEEKKREQAERTGK